MDKKVKNSDESIERNDDKQKKIQEYKVKFSLLLFFAIFMLIFRITMIPSNPNIDCFVDSVHEHPIFAYLNDLVHKDERFAVFMMLVQQYLLDLLLFPTLITWFIYSKSYSRFVLCAIAFYTFRAPHMNWFQLKIPQGMYFKYPGYVTFSTPYEKDFTDFFYSGHCGALTLAACELKRNGYKKLHYTALISLFFMVLALLILRAHYWIDISMGIVVAHYFYLLLEQPASRFDQWIYSKFSTSKTKTN